MDHDVYTNSTDDVELLLSILRVSDDLLDSILINHNILFSTCGGVFETNNINTPNFFIYPGLNEIKTEIFYIANKMYNEYVDNNTITNIEGIKYLSFWANTHSLETTNGKIDLEPLVQIPIDELNDDIEGFNYLRNYTLDRVTKTRLNDIGYEKIKKIFINLTSFPISFILLN